MEKEGQRGERSEAQHRWAQREQEQKLARGWVMEDETREKERGTLRHVW